MLQPLADLRDETIVAMLNLGYLIKSVQLFKSFPRTPDGDVIVPDGISEELARQVLWIEYGEEDDAGAETSTTCHI